MDVDAARVFAQRMRDDAEYHMVIARGMDTSDPTGVGWSYGAVNDAKILPEKAIRPRRGKLESARLVRFGHE
jgi:hypothetical protein